MNCNNMIKKIIIFLILISLSSAKMMEFKCSASSGCGDTSCPSGHEPRIMCPHSEVDPTNPTPICDICKVECARECGREATCLDDPSTAADECSSCCSTYCSKYGGFEKLSCEGMCYATCRANSEFCQAILLLQYLSLGVGTILLSINALKWMMSDNDRARNDAKKGIAYTIFALLLIITAIYLVGYFYVGTITC